MLFFVSNGKKAIKLKTYVLLMLNSETKISQPGDAGRPIVHYTNH